jgi:fatty acid desaturase
MQDCWRSVGMDGEVQVSDGDDDFSRKFQLWRPKIVDSRGLRYGDFLSTLKPRYSRLYFDIGRGYLALLVTTAILSMLSLDGTYSLAIALAGALSIGFWIAYLHLFIHEGAHFNFAADNGLSDFLCNLLIAWLIGTSVQKYRAVHFQHHRALGLTSDSESTYFSPLNSLFLFKAFFGIRVFEVMGAWKVAVPKATSSKGTYVGLVGVLIHASIVVSAFMLQAPWVSAAWIFGAIFVFPLLGFLRQLLEHRAPDADANVDYTRHDHGAYTRIFGSDVLSSLFGSAGFNRHLLHHWEPHVSYTNLPQMEAYLLDTEVAPLIEMRRASYAGTFVKLFRF